MNRLLLRGIFVLLSVALLVWLVLPSVQADLVTGIVTFSPSTTIKSADFNNNFTAITNQVNGNLNDANLKNAGITASTKLIDATVSLAKMQTDSVNSAKIVNESIQSGDVLDGSLLGVDFLDDTIGEVKMAINTASGAGVDGHVLYWNDGAGKLDYKLSTGTDEDCLNVHMLTDLAPTGGGFVTFSYDIFDGTQTSGLGASAADSYVPAAISANNVYAMVESGAPGGDDTYEVIVYKNGSPTTVACTIPNAGTTCGASGAAASFARGDRIQVDFKQVDGGDVTDSSTPGTLNISLCTSPY